MFFVSDPVVAFEFRGAFRFSRLLADKRSFVCDGPKIVVVVLRASGAGVDGEEVSLSSKLIIEFMEVLLLGRDATAVAVVAVKADVFDDDGNGRLIAEST